ncbi:MAG: AI-2E family transporter [Sandaracinaceae bacterium]|nr:AI-2E family transporter [Sandaracinaceae bacterium]
MEMKLGAGAKAVMMLAGITAVVWGLHEARPFIVPLITAGFITVISLPVVVWLTARGFPRWSAILLAVLLDLAVLFGFGGLVGGSLNEFYDRVPTYQARLASLTADAALWVEHQGLDVDPDTVSRAVARVGVMDLVADLFQRVWAFGSNALLVALLVLFMLFEAGPWRIKLAYVLHSPTSDLPRFANAAREIQTYLVVKSGLSVVTGGLCGVWVAVCGVDFPLLWALLAFFLNFIPTLGMFIATIPPVVVALIQFGPGTAILVLAGYLVINFTLGNFVEPRVMGRALGLSPLVVFLSMVFWGLLWGPIGALLAVPLTMVIKILLASTEDLRWAAVLLGSREWLEQRRREWEDPFEAEKRRSLLPDYLGVSESIPPPPPEAPAEEAAAADLVDNPPLHDEDPEVDQYSGMRPRPDGGKEAETG